MNMDQYKNLMGVLREIRDRLPAVPDKSNYGVPTPDEDPCRPIPGGGWHCVPWKPCAKPGGCLLPDDDAPHNADDGASLVGPLCVHGFVADGQACGEFGCTKPAPKPAPKQVAQSQALYAVLVTLDAWIEGARSNHVASGHRGENTGEECWRTFTPADFRVMINDAARDLGLSEFPLPDVAKEDTA